MISWSCNPRKSGLVRHLPRNAEGKTLHVPTALTLISVASDEWAQFELCEFKHRASSNYSCGISLAQDFNILDISLNFGVRESWFDGSDRFNLKSGGRSWDLS